MKHIYIALILLVIVLKANSQIVKVDVKPSSQPKGSLMLSDLAEQVEYIPLETNDKCVVGKITYFDLSENYIVVCVFQTKEIFLFTRTGKFLTKIGKQGQGPGEFLYPSSIFIDELKKFIYVYGGNEKLLVYDFSGKYITSYTFNRSNIMILAYNNNQFITGAGSVISNEDYFVYSIWDSTLKQIKQAVKGVPVEIKGSFNGGSHVGPPISCYIYKGFPHLKESVLNDTIYQLNKNNEFLPEYIINCGRYGMTPEILGDTDHFLDNLKRYVGGMYFYETPNFLMSKYNFNNEWISCYFDKKANKLLYFNSKDGIQDDYSGGIDFWPSKQINDYWYAFYNASELLDKFDKQKKIAPKGPSSTVQKIQSQINSLDAEDNPVLIVVKLKQ